MTLQPPFCDWRNCDRNLSISLPLFADTNRFCSRGDDSRASQLHAIKYRHRWSVNVVGDMNKATREYTHQEIRYEGPMCKDERLILGTSRRTRRYSESIRNQKTNNWAWASHEHLRTFNALARGITDLPCTPISLRASSQGEQTQETRWSCQQNWPN